MKRMLFNIGKAQKTLWIDRKLANSNKKWMLWTNRWEVDQIWPSAHQDFEGNFKVAQFRSSAAVLVTQLLSSINGKRLGSNWIETYIYSLICWTYFKNSVFLTMTISPGLSDNSSSFWASNWYNALYFTRIVSRADWSISSVVAVVLVLVGARGAADWRVGWVVLLNGWPKSKPDDEKSRKKIKCIKSQHFETRRSQTTSLAWFLRSPSQWP